MLITTRPRSGWPFTAPRLVYLKIADFASAGYDPFEKRFHVACENTEIIAQVGGPNPIDIPVGSNNEVICYLINQNQVSVQSQDPHVAVPGYYWFEGAGLPSPAADADGFWREDDIGTPVAPRLGLPWSTAGNQVLVAVPPEGNPFPAKRELLMTVHNEGQHDIEVVVVPYPLTNLAASAALARINVGQSYTFQIRNGDVAGVRSLGNATSGCFSLQEAVVRRQVGKFRGDLEIG